MASSELRRIVQATAQPAAAQRRLVEAATRWCSAACSDPESPSPCASGCGADDLTFSHHVIVQDGGGRPQSGDERTCQAVRVDSERELQREVVAITRALSLDVDWEKRIVALERLEGLVAGNAPQLGHAFEASVRSLQDLLIQQITDRW